ncbi:MAG: M23 family metallopeptidase [Planctomycetota bacterium]
MFKTLPLPGATIRMDAMGSGAFRSARTKTIGDVTYERQHIGVDLWADPGALVIAPCACSVVRLGYPYHPSKSQLRLVELTWPMGLQILMYLDEVHVNQSDVLRAGDTIGLLGDVSEVHGSGMKPHLHWQVELGSSFVLQHPGYKLSARALVDPMLLVEKHREER